MSRLLLRILFAALITPAFITGQVNAQTTAAQPSTSTASGKLAWINLDQTILTCDEGKNMLAEIEKFIDEKNGKLDAMKKEADSLRAKLNMQASKVTDEERADQEEKVEAAETGLQRFQQDTQKEINGKRDRLTNYIGKKLLPIFDDIAKKRQLSAILFISPNRDAWIDPSLIITDEVVKAYNLKYPVAASKAPAAPAPAKKQP
jgi:outer membrane protein